MLMPPTNPPSTTTTKGGDHMADILGLQEQEPDETPGPDKASRMSWRFCRNSYISIIAC